MHRAFDLLDFDILKCGIELIFYHGFFVVRDLETKKELATNHMKIDTKHRMSENRGQVLEDLRYICWSAWKIR